MRPAIESVASTHPESATAKRGATTAKTSAMEPAASKAASAAMEAATAAAKTTASAAVPSASCQGGVMSRDTEQRAKNQRKERNELRPADRHGTLRYNGPQEPHARVLQGRNLNQFIK